MLVISYTVSFIYLPVVFVYGAWWRGYDAPATESPSFPSRQNAEQRNREEVRRAILAAARAVMREQGVAALSLREVARRADASPLAVCLFPQQDGALRRALLDGGAAPRRVPRAPTRGSTTSGTGCTPASRATCGSLRRTRSSINSPLNVPFRASSPLRRAWRRLSGHCGLEQFLADAVASGQIVLDMPVVQARDLLIGMIHGLTAQHMANEPDLPIGSGRFGSQIPAAVALFRAKWDPRGANPGVQGKE